MPTAKIPRTTHDDSDPNNTIRHNWSRDEVVKFFDLSFNDLLFRAHYMHCQRHDPNSVQVSTLLSIKIGARPEDCEYSAARA